MADEKCIAAEFYLRFNDVGATGFELDVNTLIPGKGVTAIFGQSGSGKTTFLRCLAGLEKPDVGKLIVLDEVWQDESVCLPTHKRSLGYVFQEASLFSHLTAKGNLEYAVHRSSKNVDANLYEKAIEIMGIGPILDRGADKLSGGEKQRVAIARALLIQPKVLLMDEPLASLDTSRKQEILPYLERLHQDYDVPILYVSHSLDEVTRLADHAVVLDKGKVIGQGDLQAVFSRLDMPVGQEEAGGIINAKVIAKDPQWHLMQVTFEGGEMWLRDSGDIEGSAIRIRILARDVSLSLNPIEDSSVLNKLAVEVLEICEDVDPAMALVGLKSGAALLIARITQKSLSQLQLSQGQKVWANIKSAAIIR